MILQPKTHKAARLLQKHGTEWVKIRTQPSVYFSDRQGPWAMIQPVDGNDEHVRWVHLVEDKDFIVVR